MSIKQPYLLFVGEAADCHEAKTAAGIYHWRPEACVGQWRSTSAAYDLGLPDIDFAEAAARGAATLVVGSAPTGGQVSDAWIAPLSAALNAGLDLAAGLHQRLADIEPLRLQAIGLGLDIHDIRQPNRSYPVGNGRKRGGRRVLAVGTDCAVGKMYTALALEKALLERQVNATFRATGQTGIFIAGDGICIDAIVSDFVAGAVEWLTPDADDDHWDVIEGQGSLFHPGYAGVSLGLIHGAQPDALILCHDAARTHIDGLPDFPLPSLEQCMALNLEVGARTNPGISCVGVSANTSRLPPGEADSYLQMISDRLGLPCVDPVRTGVGPLVDALLS